MSQGHCIHILKHGSSGLFAGCYFSSELSVEKYEVRNVEGEGMPEKDQLENYQRRRTVIYYNDVPKDQKQ